MTATSIASCRLSWSEWRPTRSPALPELRPATAGDTPALLEVFFRATEDLDERRGRPLQPRNPAPLERHIRHLIGTDPERALLAEDRGRPVAFGISMVRGESWFLSFLFVSPEWQGHGLGRAILDACLRDAGPTMVRSTCAEANQPVATGLYASLGMAPRLPVYVLRGDLDADALPALPETLRVRPLSEAAAGVVDAAVMAQPRPQDHGFWAQHDRRGWAYQTSGGEVIGYGYAQPSGRIGPVAAIDPAHLLPMVGHLVRSTAVIEGWQLVVPGPAISVLEPLLRAGLRIDGTPAVYCADRTVPRFDRYVPGSFALL